MLNITKKFKYFFVQSHEIVSYCTNVLPKRFYLNAGGVLPYISHTGMGRPPPPLQRVGVLHRFGLNIDFAHFGLESGMVYEGIRVVYQCVRFVVTIANE